MKRLYLDIGSTNIKWIFNGKLYQTPFPSPAFQSEKRFEVLPEAIVSNVRMVLENFQPTELYISVQMHGYVLLKKGKEATRYISWRDTRGRKETPDFVLTEEYGVHIKPNLPRLSLQTQNVDFDTFCTLGSYVVYKLTGENVTHISDAAPSGFYNVRNHTQDEQKFSLPTASYEVKAVGRYGNTDVYTPVGDQQAAILGVGGDTFEGYILNLGTAAQLCCVEQGFVAGAFESRPFFGEKTLCTVTELPGGGALSELSDEEAEDMLLEEYDKALARLPKKQRLLATGGVVKYRRELLQRVLTRLGVAYSFNETCDALEGLKILAEGQQ